MKITQRELADAIHVPYQCINEFVNQKRGITPSTALCLGRFLGTSAEFWLNFQLRWELHRAEREERDELKRIRKHDRGRETA